MTYGSAGVCELLERVRRFLLFRNLDLALRKELHIKTSVQTARKVWYFSEEVRMWEIVRVILAANSKNIPWCERGPATLVCVPYFKAWTKQCNWWNI